MHCYKVEDAIHKTLDGIPLFFGHDSIRNVLGVSSSDSGLSVSILLALIFRNTMLHGGSLVFTTLLSRIIVKRMVYRHNILGCVFSITGFAIVGYAGFLSS